MRRPRLFLALFALCAALVAIAMLERGRLGLQEQVFRAGATPATLIQRQDADGPLVLIAHGFAGSQQMMQAYARTLADAGYRAVTFDFAGHGQNPTPLSGDVTQIDGTTQRLVAESGAVLDAARALTGNTAPAAALGHSMASDIVVRLAAARGDIAAVIGISMYSEAVTPTFPERLLVISGAGEPNLRANALDALRLVAPAAAEGETVRKGAVVRRAAVAPGVEHVGVLHSETAVREALAWLNDAFARTERPAPTLPGRWVALLLGAVLLLGWSLSPLIGPPRKPHARLQATRVMLITWGGAAAGILAGAFLPLDLRDAASLGTVTLFLGANGLVQLALLRREGALVPGLSLRGLAFVLALGILCFAMALDRYGASFVPHGPRLGIALWLAFGAIPLMLADMMLFGAREQALWLRIVARVPLVLGPSLAAVFVPEEVVFLAVSAPLMILFLLLLHPIARWSARRGGPLSAGLGAGVLLAWSLASAYPLFAGG